MRLLVIISIACALISSVVHADTSNLEQAFEQLVNGSFDEKAVAINQLANSGHDASEAILKSLLEGDLYYIKKDKRVVLTRNEGSELQLNDALTGEDLGLVSKRKVKKIGINNSLRSVLKQELANLKLNHPDPAQRLVAIEGMIGQVDEDTLEQLKKMSVSEQSQDVLQAIIAVVAFEGLSAEDAETRLRSIEQLDGFLASPVLNQFKRMAENDQDRAVRNAASKAITKIESRVSLFGYLETLFFGLSLGSILALAAIGLAITFGVMGVINMAHGEMIMIGAYTTYVIQQLMPNAIGLSILVAIPAAFLVSALVGIAIERGVIRFLYGRPLETLLATFGISLFLQQTVRSIFSPLNRSVETPQWMSGSLEINSLLSITYNRLYIFFFCLVVFLLLYLVMKKTSLGLHVRAVSQNRNMARAMGVRSQWVDAMTFGLGSGIAGLAGVALSQITNVGPNLGQAYIVDSFMVVVFGGVGNLWGTLISGLSLGVVNKFLEPATGAVLSKILVLIFIILFIQKRPRGLFPQKGRAAEQ